MKKILFSAVIGVFSMAANADIIKVKTEDAGKSIDLVVPSNETHAIEFKNNITSIGLGLPEYYSADKLKSGKTLMLKVIDAENSESSNLIVETEDGLLYEFNLTVTIDGMVWIKPMNKTS